MLYNPSLSFLLHCILLYFTSLRLFLLFLLQLQGQIDGSVIQALADALRDEDEDG